MARSAATNFGSFWFTSFRNISVLTVHTEGPYILEALQAIAPTSCTSWPSTRRPPWCATPSVSLKRGLAGYIVPSMLYGILAAGRPYVAAVEEACEVAAITKRTTVAC